MGMGGAAYDPENWNFDPGTTVRIYHLRYADYVGAVWKGNMAFMKGDQFLGGWVVPRRGKIVSYYRDMEDLGFFIP